MSGLISHLRRHSVGYLALFVALGGTSWAAANLPKNSVGTKQLRKSAVTTSKLHKKAVTGSKVATHSLTSKQIAGGAIGTYQFGTIPAVRAINSTAETTPNDAPFTLTFDGNDYDNASMHSTPANSRVTAPVSGVYEIDGQVKWQANPTGVRALLVFKDGNLAAPIAITEGPAVNSVTEFTVQHVATRLASTPATTWRWTSFRTAAGTWTSTRLATSRRCSRCTGSARRRPLLPGSKGDSKAILDASAAPG